MFKFDGVVEQLVREMAHDELGGLSPDGVDDRLSGCQRIRSAVAAYEARLIRHGEVLAERMGLRPASVAHLSATLGVSAREARATVKVAEALKAVPAAEEALSAGQITAGHADVLARRLPAEHREAAAVDPDLIRAACCQSVDGFRRSVDEFVRVQSGDLDGAERARRRHDRRRASVFTDDDGMVRFDALLPPDTGALVSAQLGRIQDGMYRDVHEAHYTAGQRAADSFVEMARQAAGGGGVALAGWVGTNDATGEDGASGDGTPSVRNWRRTRTEMVVLVDHRWLSGQLDDAMEDGRLPRCEIPGVGELAPATARRLACEAAIIPMVMGGSSQPLDVGRRRYRVTPAQRLALVVRDGGCVWPGCDHPPAWCEAHHLDEWLRDDGPTDLVNLALLCSRHHHDVHEGGRVLEQDDQGGWQVRLGLPPPRAPTAA
ncbi:MAG: DUF222 domain-containing protein [Acidimicrobiia bacterium]|nr:DUF222 domain-containing protein [Actinomycetota bacterium]MBL6925245.1 DUF222 domain-containing protein [Acidimicrobiia bacterium]MBL6926513.1 DUF222 domain-containing protein [Acidimicrobiia bacterium]